MHYFLKQQLVTIYSLKGTKNEIKNLVMSVSINQYMFDFSVQVYTSIIKINT
jgi:hypothetical protein